jgi:hypothetical protein
MSEEGSESQYGGVAYLVERMGWQGQLPARVWTAKRLVTH